MSSIQSWLNRLSVSILVALGLNVVIDAYKPRTDAAAGAAYAGQSESFSPAPAPQPEPEPQPEPQPDGNAGETDETGDNQAGQEPEEEPGPSDAEEADESVLSPTYHPRYRRVGPLRRLFGRGGG